MSQSISAAEVKTIIFACEAGMGSSLMSVNSLKKKLKAAQISDVTVVHKPAREIPADAQVVIVHKGLAKTARTKAPNAVVVAFNHFLNDPVFDKLVQSLVDKSEINSTEAWLFVSSKIPQENCPSLDVIVTKHLNDVSELHVLSREGLRLTGDQMAILSKDRISLQASAADKLDAIRKAGELLVNSGCVLPEYVDGMLKREESMSTSLGNGVSIPHGVYENREHILHTGISVLQLIDGVEWDANDKVFMVIGIAAAGDEHVGVLSNLAEVIDNEETLTELLKTNDPDVIIKYLGEKESA